MLVSDVAAAGHGLLLPAIVLTFRALYPSLVAYSDGVDKVLSPKSHFNQARAPTTTLARWLLVGTGGAPALLPATVDGKVLAKEDGGVVNLDGAPGMHIQALDTVPSAAHACLFPCVCIGLAPAPVC